MLARMWRKSNTPPLLVGLQTGTTTLKINLAVSQKTGNSSMWRPSCRAPEPILKRSSTVPHVLHYVHSSLIHNRQKLEATQMPLNREMDTELMVKGMHPCEKWWALSPTDSEPWEICSKLIFNIYFRTLFRFVIKLYAFVYIIFSNSSITNESWGLAVSSFIN